ncbi:hypothetical protein RchiOBHm_Chr6g0278251 [Rosa chinensis]|uniref:Uncharacterized protein n=1 Tax=Rosa chinensis TaxID=74649 RepID=A0A2P6PSP5_ROSCH|nr:hypothetical protein RchiOBHm_Chr6g0278251 [Rosa chinensis]
MRSGSICRRPIVFTSPLGSSTKARCRSVPECSFLSGRAFGYGDENQGLHILSSHARERHFTLPYL